jgi:MOSC domain-containing protein YiiM
VRTDFGIPEDYRSGKSKRRQLTLIEEEALAEAARILGRFIPEGASRRQVVVRGLDLNTLIGHSVRIGDLVLAIERYCAPCHRMNEEMGPGGRDALRWKAGVTCMVVKGGMLKVGEKVVLEHDHE